jgi:hypothetical protein
MCFEHQPAGAKLGCNRGPHLVPPPAVRCVSGLRAAIKAAAALRGGVYMPHLPLPPALISKGSESHQIGSRGDRKEQREGEP